MGQAQIGIAGTEPDRTSPSWFRFMYRFVTELVETEPVYTFDSSFFLRKLVQTKPCPPLVPFFFIIVDHFFQNSFYHLVTSLCLAIRLGIVRSGLNHPNSPIPRNDLNSLAHESLSSVCHLDLGNLLKWDGLHPLCEKKSVATKMYLWPLDDFWWI